MYRSPKGARAQPGGTSSGVGGWVSQLAGCTACKSATWCVRLPDALGQDRSGGRLPPGKSDAHYLIRAVKSFFRQPPRATFLVWVQGSGGDRVQWTKQEAAAGAALRFLQGHSCPQQKSAKRERGESKLLLCLASFPGAEWNPLVKTGALRQMQAGCFVRRTRRPASALPPLEASVPAERMAPNPLFMTELKTFPPGP